MPTKKQPGVVLLDSGVDPHPDLTDCVRVFIDFLHQKKSPMMITDMEHILQGLLQEQGKCPTESGKAIHRAARCMF